MTIQPNPELLEALTRDGSDEWRATAYWKPYEARVARTLRSESLEGFRRNQRILKGFAAGGALEPALPTARWKRRLWSLLDRGPVVAGWRKVARAEHRHRVSAEVTLARLALDRIADDFEVRLPDTTAGDPEDVFEWEGQPVSAAVVPYLARAADFYRQVPLHDVRSLIEIGPGLGFSTVAHLSLNPHLNRIVNVDLPMVLYVQTVWLGATLGGVATYLADQPKDGVWCIPPWKLPDVSGTFDLACNAFSFQEMERDVVGTYVGEFERLQPEWVLLHSAEPGHRPGAGGQKKPIPLDWLTSLFGGTAEPLGGLWTELYATEGAAARLIRMDP